MQTIAQRHERISEMDIFHNSRLLLKIQFVAGKVPHPRDTRVFNSAQHIGSALTRQRKNGNIHLVLAAVVTKLG